MRSEIELFINLNFSQEKTELFKKCFSVFEEFHLEDYDTNILELISLFDSMETAELLLEFEMIVKNTLVSVINSHGVEIDDEARLDVICEIAYSLNAIQTYEDQESIIRTLETDYDNEEKLCQLFRFVSLTSVDNFMLAINSVDQNIFRKIYELYQNIDSDKYSAEEIAVTNKIVSQLKELKTFLQYDAAIGFKLLTKGLSVNGDFNLYVKYCIEKFETMELDLIAKELLVILFMSKQSYTSPIMFFRSVSSNLFEDINKITKIDVMLNILLNNFSKYKAEKLNQSLLAVENMEQNTNDDEVPVGEYLGFMTGYIVTFIFNDKEHEVKMDCGVKGRDIPCKITKNENGIYTVSME